MAKCITWEFERGKKASDLKWWLARRPAPRSPSSPIARSSRISSSNTKCSPAMRELAYLNQSLQIIMKTAQRKRDEVSIDDGLVEYVRYLNDGKNVIHRSSTSRRKIGDGLILEVALQYNDGYKRDIRGSPTTSNTHEGRTHMSVLRRAHRDDDR